MIYCFSALKRKLADKVAAAGFYTVVPDFLGGDPYVPENAERPFSVWLKDHGTVSYHLFPLHNDSAGL